MNGIEYFVEFVEQTGLMWGLGFQVLHAQQAGYSAAIVHNMYSDTLLNMNYSNGNNPLQNVHNIKRYIFVPSYKKAIELMFFFLYFPETIAEQIEIPSVFTSYYAAQILRNFIIPEQG